MCYYYYEKRNDFESSLALANANHPFKKLKLNKY